jgi:hypothetical protein
MIMSKICYEIQAQYEDGWIWVWRGTKSRIKKNLKHLKKVYPRAMKWRILTWSVTDVETLSAEQR